VQSRFHLFAHSAARRREEAAGDRVREDVAASGGYMVACAADEIICDLFVDRRLRSAWSAARSGFNQA